MPPQGAQAPLYAQRANFWLSNPKARPGLFLQKKVYSGFWSIAKSIKQGEVNPHALEPWLFSLINLVVDPSDRHEVYHLISLLGTASASEFLFSELERPGRHPYSTGLLNAVKELASPDNTQRILDLHPSFAEDRAQLKEYLKVVECLRGKEAHLVIIAILHRHASLAEKFNKEERLPFFDLIAELIDHEPEGIRVSLADMNAKIDDPALNAAAPVTWPQMLGPNWEKLVQDAEAEALFGVVANYLERKEPWLQRCALLQLDTWVEAQGSPPPIPRAVERQLQKRLISRHEKVYTAALNIIEKVFDQLAEQELMVDTVLKHAHTSRYRLMNAAVLKKAAQNPALKVQQIKRMRTALFRASADELPSLKTLIPYLRFLESKEQFRKLAKERQDLLARS